MFKPMLICGTLLGVLGAPVLQAEQAPAPEASTPAAGQQTLTTAPPQLPAWVIERHAELGPAAQFAR